LVAETGIRSDQNESPTAGKNVRKILDFHGERE
jgi:hypothetical protein